MVSVLIGEPTATDDTSSSSLAPGEAGGDPGRCGDDADDDAVVDIGDIHAVVATDEFEAAFGETRHRSSVLPLGERCDEDFCTQFPIMVLLLTPLGSWADNETPGKPLTSECLCLCSFWTHGHYH